MSVDFSTTYLGLRLASPLVASASPCTGQTDVLKRMEASGAGAAVLPSLFEEQVDTEAHVAYDPPLANGFPHLKQYNTGVDRYPRLVEDAKRAVGMPIIGSLNGATPGGWVEHARRIASAGADALELNLHFVPIDPGVSSQLVEAQYLDLIAAIRCQVTVPLAVKVGPWFTSLPYFARQANEAGADGLVLFNRYLEPDVDLEQQTVQRHLELSRSAESRLALRWIGVLRDQLIDCSLAATGGFASGEDALKGLAVGADVVMVASALLRRGAEYLQTMRRDMIEWLENHDYGSVRRLVGMMSRQACGVPAAFDRANYAGTLASYLDQGACPG